MTRNRWWTLIAVLALAPFAVRSRAGAQTMTCVCAPLGQKSSPKLIQKSYPVGGLVQTLSEGPAGSRGTDLLIRAITGAVKPESWSKRGGRGTIDYCPEGKSLIVKQTAGVHERVEAVLKALAAIQPKQPAAISPITPAAYSSPSAHLKQYGHFVLDNVRVNAMGVSCTIKRVRFMYKGDGIDPDVAKSGLPLSTPPEAAVLDAASAIGNVFGRPCCPAPCCPAQCCPAPCCPSTCCPPAYAEERPTEQSKLKIMRPAEAKAKFEKGKAKPE